MKVGYKLWIRILIWALFLLTVPMMIMMLAEGEGLASLLTLIVALTILSPVLMNRHFTVDKDKLEVFAPGNNIAYDHDGLNALLLEDNKVYVVTNRKRKRVVVYAWLASRKDWEAFKVWVAEHRPEDYQELSYDLGRVERAVQKFNGFCRAYATVLWSVLALVLLGALVYWGQDYWEQRSEIAALVAQAEADKSAQDWHAALATTRQILELVPNHERAEELRNTAWDALRPAILIRATLNGEDVPGNVMIKRWQRLRTHSLPLTKSLSGDRPYVLYGSYEADGQWYVSSPRSLTPDWEGVREIELVMKPHTGRFPIQGEHWRSPATGMEFFWVDALGCWVGKFEVTNEEYRIKIPDHDSGEFEGHTLDLPRQPVVQISFVDATSYALWLTMLEWDAGDLPTGYRYRLPSDEEFHELITLGYEHTWPWGDEWPPPMDLALNFNGEEGVVENRIIEYRDEFIVSAPVDDLWVNPWGLAGVAGNVWQATSRRGDDAQLRTWRGGAWTTGTDTTFSRGQHEKFGIGREHRRFEEQKSHDGGFRLVLAP